MDEGFSSRCAEAELEMDGLLKRNTNITEGGKAISNYKHRTSVCLSSSNTAATLVILKPLDHCTTWLILFLLITDSGLGQADGNPGSHHLANGTLGQSVTLSANIPGAELLIIAWDFRNSSTGRKIPVCTKTQNTAVAYDNELRDRVRLNLNDYSLEILTLMKSDQGLYEVSARSKQNVHNEVIELRVYERVPCPRIQLINNVSSAGICNVTLSCSVESGSDLIYCWCRGGEVVTADSSHSVTDNGRKLRISLNRHYTSTIYNCKAMEGGRWNSAVSSDSENTSCDIYCRCHYHYHWVLYLGAKNS
ncbi:SLAM family member 9-like [Heterodontus francisci]|uniref:SLAM family member 9-like n=1 Tax=Heterodontus francisci TaxID=7792 RepID=UPI00355C9B7B